MKKIITGIIFSIILLTTSQPVNANKVSINTDSAVIAESNQTTSQVDEFKTAYEQGRAKGIINDSNLSYADFENLCKKSVFPAYLQATTVNPVLTFQQFIAEDNYEVPIGLTSNTTTTSASEPSNVNPYLRSSAHGGYSMKAGDILIVYGRNSMGRFVGHAAIASSSKYIMEMPGYRYRRARHTTKKLFFKTNSGKGKFVYVYRFKAHPKYADVASTYAYKKMYKKDNPYYALTLRVWHKSPTYCSKYVYLAYAWGATKKSIVPVYATLMAPHSLPNDFKWHASCIHKITSY